MNRKILIDSTSLLSPLTGIGRYTLEVAKILQCIDLDSKYYFYYGVVSEKLKSYQEQDEAKFTLSGIKNIVSKYPRIKNIIKQTLDRLSPALYTKYDLYWQPNFIPRNGIKAKKVISTVHDFAWHIEPSWHTLEQVTDMQNRFWNGIKKADRIITGSEFTKAEIIKYLNYNPDKIDVIYHGVNHKTFYISNSNTLDLPQKYILAVGSLEPRKNLLNLLKAYNLLSEELKEEVKLVLVGFKGWANTQIMSLIAQNKQNVIYLGFLSDDKLREVYNRSHIFIYPSLYEGFGIPPLEAMACGVPVIASHAASLPEVCKDAALYIDPLSINELSSAITKLIQSNELCENYSAKGIERVKNFTWEHSAKLHLKVFNKAI